MDYSVYLLNQFRKIFPVAVTYILEAVIFLHRLTAESNIPVDAGDIYHV